MSTTIYTGYNSGFSQPTATGSTQNQHVGANKTQTDEEIQRGFVNASKTERVRLNQWFVTLGVTNFLFTAEDGYDSVDGYFQFPGVDKKYVIEAKNRNIRVNQYRTHPFEKTKYDALRKERNRGYHPLFIVFCTDGAILYNLGTRMADEANHGLVFKLDSKFPQTTMGRSTSSCTRLVADISKDLGTWKDRVYLNS